MRHFIKLVLTLKYIKPRFHLVVSSLSRSLLNLKFLQTLAMNDYMETRMKFLQRPLRTLKNSQRLGCWARLEIYLRPAMAGGPGGHGPPLFKVQNFFTRYKTFLLDNDNYFPFIFIFGHQ